MGATAKALVPQLLITRDAPALTDLSPPAQQLGYNPPSPPDSPNSIAVARRTEKFIVGCLQRVIERRSLKPSRLRPKA